MVQTGAIRVNPRLISVHRSQTNSLRYSPCVRLKAQPDVWVAFKVDALVRSARAAYESDDLIPAYGRVLD